MDTLSQAARSRNMSRIRSKDTKPELAVRRAAHRLGFRFRLHRRDLPGCPDLVFPRLRTVIFVHGCFWHGHGRCRDGRIPKSRRAYWRPKLQGNKRRDARNRRRLRSLGWRTRVIWGCNAVAGSKLDAVLARTLGPGPAAGRSPT